MNKKKLLVCALALSTVGVLSTIDTAGVLPFSAKTVHADDIVAVGNVDHKVNLSLVGYDKNRGVSVTFSTDSVNPNFVNNWNSKQDYIFVRTKLVNAKTKEVVDDNTGAQVSLRSYDLTKSSNDSYLYDSIPDGEYKYEAYVSEFYIDPQTKLRHQYKGESPIFSIKDGKFAGLVSSTQSSTTPTTTATPKQSTSSKSGQTGWSGSSYYKAGVKVVNQWIFDVQYNSYFYLNASGNFVQNAWSGSYYLKSGGYMAKSEWIYDNNYQSYYYLTAEGSYARNAWAGSYYLKSDGKMAKSEWIYDSSYQSYYYLTSEGSYARNTWVGDYYLKSNGKMAVNERTPDGYQVDGSGKWVRQNDSL